MKKIFKKVFWFWLYALFALFLLKVLFWLSVFVFASDDVPSVKNDLSLMNKKQIVDYCTYENYYNDNVCKFLRFVLVHKYIEEESCTDRNLLCVDYYKSGDYYSDHDIVKKKCLGSDSKECFAFSFIDNKFFK